MSGADTQFTHISFEGNGIFGATDELPGKIRLSPDSARSIGRLMLLWAARESEGASK